jgi:hypothetical protein
VLIKIKNKNISAKSIKQQKLRKSQTLNRRLALLRFEPIFISFMLPTFVGLPLKLLIQPPPTTSYRFVPPSLF